MRRARALDENRQPVPGRGADGSAPRPTPLTLISGAVAGDDLRGVASTVAQALRRPVAIAIPGLGEPVVHPADSLPAVVIAAIAGHAAAISRGDTASSLRGIADTVPVRIGEDIVGIVAAAGQFTPASAGGRFSQRRAEGERQAWLEAAAAAVTLAALTHESDSETPPTEAALVIELAGGQPSDLPAVLTAARRLGLELDDGATAFAIRGDDPDANPVLLEHLRDRPGVVVAELEPGRIVGLAQSVAPLAAELRARGLTVAVSDPESDPARLHDAISEARLLVEVMAGSREPPGAQETYRLLIGVLLRDRGELELLRDRTVAPLSAYDDKHETDLLFTLRAFLAHNGSTTETADALSLHRHTVGYRLSRVHEVSGLSPYESNGRERLGLGLKARDLLAAHRALGAAPADATVGAPGLPPDQPADQPSDQSPDRPADPPADRSPERPADPPAYRSPERSADPPADRSPDQPSDQSPDRPADPPGRPAPLINPRQGPGEDQAWDVGRDI